MMSRQGSTSLCFSRNSFLLLIAFGVLGAVHRSHHGQKDSPVLSNIVCHTFPIPLVGLLTVNPQQNESLLTLVAPSHIKVDVQYVPGTRVG